MKMVMAVVPRDQTDQILECLIGAGYTATFTEGRGGVLRQAEHMLFIAVTEEAVEAVLDIIRRNCRSRIGIESGATALSTAALGTARGFASAGVQPASAEVGWAMVFVWDLDRVENF